MSTIKAKTKWDFCWKREYSLFYGVSVLQGLNDAFKEKINKKALIRGEGKDGQFASYSEKGYVDLFKEALLKEVENNPLIKKEIDEMKQRGEDFVKFLTNLKFSQKTANEKILSFYKNYYNNLRRYGNSLWKSFYFVDAVAFLFEEQLRKELPSQKIASALNYFSIPAEKATLFIISDYFKKEKNIGKRVKFIQDNFPWIGNIDPFVDTYTRKELYSHVKSFVLEENRVEKEEFNLKNKETVKIYQKALFIKDKRDDYRREAFYHGLPLVKEISRRLRISVNELGYLLPYEIFDKNIKDKINSRKKGYIAEVDEEKINIVSGKEAEDNFIKAEQEIGIKSFKGIIGNLGRASGKVRVINKIKDLSNFKKGEILVASTTNINYVSAMNKASAFITDEGGITCHAAIVARELGRPCIVGTKIVTKVLKNGDLVEVDANKGIVKILNKK